MLPEEAIAMGRAVIATFHLYVRYFSDIGGFQFRFDEKKISSATYQKLGKDFSEISLGFGLHTFSDDLCSKLSSSLITISQAKMKNTLVHTAAKAAQMTATQSGGVTAAYSIPQNVASRACKTALSEAQPFNDVTGTMVVKKLLTFLLPSFKQNLGIIAAILHHAYEKHGVYKEHAKKIVAYDTRYKEILATLTQGAILICLRGGDTLLISNDLIGEKNSEAKSAPLRADIETLLAEIKKTYAAAKTTTSAATTAAAGTTITKPMDLKTELFHASNNTDAPDAYYENLVQRAKEEKCITETSTTAGFTALHFAAQKGNYKRAEVLLRADSTLKNIPDNKGRTAFAVATINFPNDAKLLALLNPNPQPTTAPPTTNQKNNLIC